MGKPTTACKSTYEVVSWRVAGVCDSLSSLNQLSILAIAHRRAYGARIAHRDLRNGHVLSARHADEPVRGYLQDFDRAMNWKRFLVDVKQSDPTLEAWGAYALEEYKRYMAKRNERVGKKSKPKFDFFNENANAGVDSSGPAPMEKPGVRQGPPCTPAGPTDAGPPCTPGGSKDAPHLPEKPKDEQGREEQQQRTGTIYFMAIEIHDKGYRGAHEARHDLESFYWLLVWIVLRHVECQSFRLWHNLFDHPDTVIALDVKRLWLRGAEQRICIPGNQPLEDLLEQLRLLFQHNIFMAKLEMRITHSMVLQIFSAYLEDRSLWPEADCARRWVMPDTRPDERPRPKGTLSFSLTAQKAQLSVAPNVVLTGIVEAAPDANYPRGEEHTESSDADIEDEPIKKGKGPARKTVARRPRAGRGAVAHSTSATMSQPSGSHEAPRGSKYVQARYGLRSATKKEELPRKSARSATRSMGAPPVPATRGMDPSVLVTRSRSQSSRLAAAPQGSCASKRSHPQEEERDWAGTSRSLKRQRTFSQSRTSFKGSRTVKSKKRA